MCAAFACCIRRRLICERCAGHWCGHQQVDSRRARRRRCHEAIRDHGMERNGRELVRATLVPPSLRPQSMEDATTTNCTRFTQSASETAASTNAQATRLAALERACRTLASSDSPSSSSQNADGPGLVCSGDPAECHVDFHRELLLRYACACVLLCPCTLASASIVCTLRAVRRLLCWTVFRRHI